MKRFLAIAAACAALVPVTAVVQVATPAPAQAGPIGQGCVEDFWMWRGVRSATRVICDSERRLDGSWERRRGFFDEEYYVPFSCGRYSCWGGYWVGDLEVIDRYPVTDATVLPDEPGWIPSDNGRIVP